MLIYISKFFKFFGDLIKDILFYTGKFFRDIMRDNNSSRFSMTKFASFIGLILVVGIVVASIKIMIIIMVIDHVLIVEVIGFALTALGFKTKFGFADNKIPENDNYGKSSTTYGQRPTSLNLSKDQIANYYNIKHTNDFVDDSVDSSKSIEINQSEI